MSPPVVEIVTFTASEALLADPSLFNVVTDFLKKAEGSLSVFHGYDNENPSRNYVFIVWEKYENYEKAIALESFLAFRDNFRTLGTDPSLRHILFNIDATSALSAPITEISTYRPKEGHIQEEIDSFIQQLRDELQLIPGVHPSSAWGKVKQNTDHILAVGWDSIETYQSWSKVLSVKKALENLDRVSESSINQVILHKA